MSIFDSSAKKILDVVYFNLFHRHKLASAGLINRSKGAKFRNGNKISIGSRCFFDEGSIVDAYSAQAIGVRIGDRFICREYSIIESHKGSIEIGDNCFVGPHCLLYGQGGLKIGNYVMIAGGTTVVPSNHNFSDLNIPIREQRETSVGIIIEDDVWIGARCVILDGVTVGRGAIVAAGAVVNRNVDPFCVVGGVPARIIGRREFDKSK